jgi:hypothetical protein
VTSPPDAFLDTLVRTAESDPRIQGLVLCGSSADTGRRDQWSDHDFLVITDDGTPEQFRTDLSWLPDADDIAWSFRETTHGLKALYRSGLLIEFAVFDRAEFAGCVLNHASVVIDRGGIGAIADEVRGRSLAPRPVDRLSEFRLVLALVYIGTGRARRGERLSAGMFLRAYAVEHLLRLARDLLPGDQTTQLDTLDVFRRFETADTDLAEAVDAAVRLDVEDVGRGLLAAAEQWLPPRWPEYPPDDIAVVRGLLGW